MPDFGSPLYCIIIFVRSPPRASRIGRRNSILGDAILWRPIHAHCAELNRRHAFHAFSLLPFISSTNLFFVHRLQPLHMNMKLRETSWGMANAFLEVSRLQPHLPL